MRQFFQDPAILTGLNLARAKLRRRAKRMSSERREAVVQVMSALLHYTDLATLRVGFYKDDGFQPLGIRFFVKLTGLSQSRFERALSDINASGLLTTYKRCKKDKNGNYIGLNAVRRVSPELFSVFGLKKWLHKQRKKCSEKLLARVEKISIAKFANLSMLTKGHAPGAQWSKVKSNDPQRCAQPPPRNKLNNPHLKPLWDILKS
jgi:DNA-binding transcriptional ArsR family regulator